MSAIQQLLTDHIDIWTAAETEKKSGRGRASGNAGSVYGIKKLRELILELAVRGKLVPQDANDEPASELLKRIQAEKAKLIAEGKIKKDKPLAAITEDEKPFELPQGWEWVRLGNVIDYVNGFAFSSKDFSSSGIGVVKIGDIQQGRLEPAYMSRVAANVVVGLDDRFKVEPGDLVIAMSGATTGKLGFNDTEEFFYLNQRVGKIVPFILEKQFLYFDLTTKIAENLKKSFGSAIPNLSTEQINAIVTALPPLTEQHRIVAKVDKLMALCDQLEYQHSNAAEAHEKLVNHLLGTLTQSQSAKDFSANWQRIAAHFDTLFTTDASIDALKQTLLQLAVMGKLVPQDVNEEPASELLKRIHAEKVKLIAEGKMKKDKPLPPITDDEKPFELPNTWQWVKLQEVFDVRDGTHDTPKYCDIGFPLITSKNISTGILDFSDIKYISEADHLKIKDRSAVKRGDILFAMIGSIGNPVIVNIDTDFSIKNMALFKPYSNNICDMNYLLKYLLIAAVAMREQSTGAVQSFVSLGIIRNYLYAMPPLAEQHRIIAKVDELMGLCDQLKSRITDASRLQQKLADVLVEQAVA